ncbi:MAG: GNAT family N-acetyltransferase [Flavobacteriaceae bacterium]|jgi:RimJ/RimL family protein N-acetyltransferase|tara:strand:- start:208 stop:720 length:513 start_codon:yes stop_codon:yes gene_type:complete
MNTQIIFETQRLIVRKLLLSDLQPFHEMQSNINVMQYVRVKEMTFEENTKELAELIGKYAHIENDFWIYAIEKKLDHKFVGTCALIKDSNKEDEIGYRFLEKYWKLGYGLEICKGIINYCSLVGMPKLIAYVADDNNASIKIVESCYFQFVKKVYDPTLKITETKYELNL